MKSTDAKNYERIEKAIIFIRSNFKKQPDLSEIANHVHLSPYHFQKIFTEWAGVSPKKFMQFLSVEHAKAVLDNTKSSLLCAAHETGLSGTSRLHDLFINIERMTPGEYKRDGEGLTVRYDYVDTPFGGAFIASTHKGVCHMAFEPSLEKGLITLKHKYQRATFMAGSDQAQTDALAIFDKDWKKLNDIQLHLSGTPFQIKVWQSLLMIPFAGALAYGDIAMHLGSPKASRAVGSAVGKNPIAFLIPCHRVIQSSGKLGEYMWGSTRKAAIMGWESAIIEQ